MKKNYLALTIIFTSLLTSCGSSKLNQKETYAKIKNLCENYQTDNVSFDAVLYCEDMNLTLTNTGKLKFENEGYTYSYSYQYLNKIGSDSSNLISTEEGTIHGSKDEIVESMYTISSDVAVVSLDIANSFKTHFITEEENSYSMKGYLTRNTIIKNTDNLDNDIRFNYELITNKEINKIEKFIISYATVRFDSIAITFTF